MTPTSGLAEAADGPAVIPVRNVPPVHAASEQLGMPG